MNRLYLFSCGGNLMLLLFYVIAFTVQLRKFPLFKSLLIACVMWLCLLVWKDVLLIHGLSKWEIITPQRTSAEFIVALFFMWAVAELTIVCGYKRNGYIWLLGVPAAVALCNIAVNIPALQPYFIIYLIITIFAVSVSMIWRAYKFHRLILQYFSSTDEYTPKWMYLASSIMIGFLIMWMMSRFTAVRGFGVAFNIFSSITLIALFILLVRYQNRVYTVYLQYKENAFNEFAEEVSSCEEECEEADGSEQVGYVRTPGNAESYAGFKERIDRLFTEEKLYLQPELTLSDLAGYLNTNRTYISYYINSVLNESFVSFVNSYRLNDAKDLLASEAAMPIDEVAVRCGFRSQTTFRRAFMKKFGESPAAYRAGCVAQS